MKKKEKINYGDLQDSPLSRFVESMNIDYEKWHDGVGYNLVALEKANTEERNAIERILVNRNPLDWRDIEALAVLDTPGARSALKTAALGRLHEVNMAVLRYAPELVDNELRTKLIVEALRSASFYDGLSHTLVMVKEYHPKEVVSELFAGLLNREGEVAVHLAAMLFYIHGKAKTTFDLENRAFYLEFNTREISARKNLLQQLCKEIKVDCREYLKNYQI